MSSDLPELRASHEDRDRVVDALRLAGGDGRLSAEELDVRLESALSARTISELTILTADLVPAPLAKDVLTVEQRGGKYDRSGHWVVPRRIELRTSLCQVLLDFTDAVISSDLLRIDVQMQHGKLVIVGAPDIQIDADGLALIFSKRKFRSDGGDVVGKPRLRIELVGTLKHAKLVERR